MTALDASARAESILRPVFIFMILTVLALVLRWSTFGNPVLHIDDQFYLLVGDRMLHGSLPYVDIWDRKPIGLFVLYAGIRLLGGEGIWQYQLVAALFAVSTAYVITRTADRYASRQGSLAAGILYLVWLHVFGGNGGQSPVFYNLLMAGAALCILNARQASSLQGLRWIGVTAMLLVGLSIQIKYNVVFEGFVFGLALLWIAWRRHGSLGRLFSDALCWAGVAVAPTAAVYIAYAAAGHGAEFFFANFQSIFGRIDVAGAAAKRVREMLILLSPLIVIGICSGLLLRRRFGKAAREDYDLLLMWLAVALLALLGFGTYYDHYALPALVPLCLACAPLLGAARSGLAVSLALIVSGVLMGQVSDGQDSTKPFGDREVRQLVERIGNPPGCLYIYAGDPILYHLTKSCFLTRYVFPSHLGSIKESKAIGVDPEAEISRILAKRPSFIETLSPLRHSANWQTSAILQAELARSYRLVLTIPGKQYSRLLYERVAIQPVEPAR